MDITLTRMPLWLSVYSESICAVAAGYPWNDRSSTHPRRHVQNRAFRAEVLFWFAESSRLDNECSRARFSYTADVAPYGSRAAIAARGKWS